MVHPSGRTHRSSTGWYGLLVASVVAVGIIGGLLLVGGGKRQGTVIALLANSKNQAADVEILVDGNRVGTEPLRPRERGFHLVDLEWSWESCVVRTISAMSSLGAFDAEPVRVCSGATVSVVLDL